MIEVTDSLAVIKEESNKIIKPKLNFESLLNYKRKVKIETVPKSSKKCRTVTDLKSMKEELKQLEDPPITPWEKQISSARLPYLFYDVPCETLAKNLLGKILVRKLENGTILKGRIVETESYLGIEDKASHTYRGKVTPRNIPMYMPPGTIYTYFIYGMNYCFNISSQEEGSAVLIRALQPLEGIEHMIENRNKSKLIKKEPRKFSELKIESICNGPSKLCMAMELVKEHSKYSMCSWKGLWIEEDAEQKEIKIVHCPRIGIDSAGPESANMPLRFYILDNPSVSKRDKKAEIRLLEET